MSIFCESEEYALSIFIKAGHSPELDTGGEPNAMAYDVDFLEGWGGHNGYRCTKCGEVICIWCAGVTGFKIGKCTATLSDERPKAKRQS